MKKTVVFGASPNPARYSFVATNRLKNSGHEVVPVGFRDGKIGELDFELLLSILQVAVAVVPFYLRAR